MYMLVAFRPLISNDPTEISCSLISYSFNSGSSTSLVLFYSFGTTIRFAKVLI